MTAITRFRGNYAFLSNFYSSPIEVNGITFPTVEHAFQAAKVGLDHPQAERLRLQRRCAALPNPADAKRFGRQLVLRTDWKTAHLPIMRRLLARKFVIGGRFHRLLADTGELRLVEGNDWGDTYWGVCNGKGRNVLGLLLMDLRAELGPHESPTYQPPMPVDQGYEVSDFAIQQALVLHDAPWG